MSMQVPGYKVERLIAEGGMASVYLAVQETLGRRVALKVLKKFDSPAEAERFLNEGRIIASLNHRNIITVYDVGVVGERYYLSMEFLEGGDLEQRIAQGMAADQALDLVEAISGCLDFVHGKGIVHRDIKPANILFHTDGTPILTDFGIAKDVDSETRLTRTGIAIGSPSYLSPEQAECKPLDGRADIYGLGIIFYEMLTGRKPFQADSYIETIVAHLTEPVPTLPPPLSPYQELVDRMLAKDPRGRFATAGDLLAYVRELRGSQPAPETPSKRREWLQAIERCGTRAGEAVEPAVEALSVWCRRRCRFIVGNERLALGVVGAVALAGAVWLLAPGEPAQTPMPSVQEQTAAVNEPNRQTVDSEQSAEMGAVPISKGAGPQAEVPVAQGSRETGQGVIPVDASSRVGPSQAPGVDQNADIERHLLLARNALDEDRLTVPETDSAYWHYREVLKRNPDHEEALWGMSQIADRYADLVEGELDRFDYSRARKYLYRGLDVEPGNERLLALKKKTNVLKDAPKRLFGKIKTLFD